MAREVDAWSRGDGAWTLSLGDERHEATAHAHGHGLLTATFGGRRLLAAVVVQGDRRHIFVGGRAVVVRFVDPLGVIGADHEEEGTGLVAPMPGKVISLLAKPGSAVGKGEPLMVLEAMKMEHTISAPRAGTLVGFRFAVGDQVSEGAELVDFD